VKLEAAIQAWRKVLGAAHVAIDRPTLLAYETATFATRQRVHAVLSPRSVAEVQACVRIANRCKVTLYPISTGRNWGYGCRVPTTTGAVVVGLSRMNAIVEHDDALGYAVVQPGVTFRQLSDYLERKRSTRMPPATGSTPDASVLANALERGIGFGVYGDRIEHLCGLEVVMPTGDVLHTGLRRFRDASARRVQRWGVGPSLDGLFSQSNLGIVTEATVWLPSRPRFLQEAVLRFRDAELGGVLEALRSLQGAGVTRGVVKISNAYALTVGSYPHWARSMDPSVRMRRPLPIRNPRWMARVQLFSGHALEGRARHASVIAALEGKVESLEMTRREPIENVPKGPHVGVPGDQGLWLLYWRAKLPVPETPDPWRDRRGAIFCCPAVPLVPVHVRRATRILSRILLAHAFEPVITLNVMNERLVHVVGGIFYDRRAKGEDARAMAAYRAAFAALLEEGYFPYRLGIQSMEALPASLDDSDAVLARIKTALDPEGILAPKRYESGRKARRKV
jgi:4-cresol dehydrogenase (hydroxylating) flavoprotein subunit